MNKKIIVSVLLILVVMSTIFAFVNIETSTPKSRLTVVIDAGHGGMDGGSVSDDGHDENYLNLQYAICLERLFLDYGVRVVMTRKSLGGLYSPLAENKKLDDMKKRKKIVDNSGADIVLSVHMNSFSLKSARGAQVFYRNENIAGRALAESIQSVFVKVLPSAKSTPAVGDYYMLNEFKIPSVIIECGYLSNTEELALLLTEDYKKLVCYSIFIGVLLFLSN